MLAMADAMNRIGAELISDEIGGQAHRPSDCLVING